MCLYTCAIRPAERETLWPSKHNRGRQNALIEKANAENEWPGHAELRMKTAKVVYTAALIKYLHTYTDTHTGHVIASRYTLYYYQYT